MRYGKLLTLGKEAVDVQDWLSCQST